MALLDFVLNLAVLLLWLNWRSVRLDPLARLSPTTLAGTLKSTKADHLKGWQFLIGLGLVIMLRITVNLEIGSPVDWTPKLDLGFVALAFRSDTLPTASLYALLSSLRFVIVFYFWLLVLVATNRAEAHPDPIQKLLRFHLGRVARWPGPMQVLLPMVLTAGLWMGLHPLLVHCRAVTQAASLAHLVAQGLLIGAGLVLSLKYLVPPILLMHMLISYVYLGNNPIWDFVSATARNLLGPLRRIPLQIAKLDLAPVAGILLVIFLLNWLPNFVAGQLALRNLTLWPP